MALPALIPAAAALGTTVIGGLQSRANTKKTIGAQKELAKYQYSKDLEMWERANAYNAPTAQMSRLKAAGLNPAMIYGSGGAKTTAAELPKYQAPRPVYNNPPLIDPTTVLSAYQNFSRQQAEIDLLREQKKLKKAESDFAGRYYYNRAGVMMDKATQEAVKSSYMSASQKNLGKRVAEGEASQWEKEQFRKLQNSELKNEMLQKQIDYYLYSTFGNMAVGAAKSLFAPFKRFKGKSVPKGVTSTREWLKRWPKTNLNNW